MKMGGCAVAVETKTGNTTRKKAKRFMAMFSLYRRSNRSAMAVLPRKTWKDQQTLPRAHFRLQCAADEGQKYRADRATVARSPASAISRRRRDASGTTLAGLGRPIRESFGQPDVSPKYCGKPSNH